MSVKDALLARISAANQGNPLRMSPEQVDARIADPKPNLIPARADRPEPERYMLFLQKCRELEITIAEVPDTDAVPQTIASYLKDLNLPGKLKLSPSPEVTGLPWDNAPLLDTSTGAAVITDQTSVTPVFA